MSLRIAALLSTLALAGCATPTAAGPAADAPRVIELTVTQEGFRPSPVTVEKDRPLKLVVTRITDETCGTEIIIPGYDIYEKLPLNKPVEIEFTPVESGELRYGCGMGMMVGGVLVIE